MLYYLFLFFALSSFDLSAKSVERIDTIEQFNKIGLWEWQRDILNSNQKQREIIQVLSNAQVSDELKDQLIEKISAWRLVCFLHDRKYAYSDDIHNAYAGFRDSLNKAQLAKLNSKYNMFLLKFFGGVGAVYTGLILLACYIEQKAKKVNIVLVQNPQ